MCCSFYSDCAGSRHEDDRRSKSTHNVGDDDTMDNGSDVTTPPANSDKKKKMWGSFRKSTNRFRFRKGKKKENVENEDPVAIMVQSSPELHRMSSANSDSPVDSPAGNSPDFDALFNAAEKRQTDPGLGSESRDKQSEVDSGIAVDENGIAVIESSVSFEYKICLLCGFYSSKLIKEKNSSIKQWTKFNSDKKGQHT